MARPFAPREDLVSKPLNKQLGENSWRKYNVRAKSQGITLTYTITSLATMTPSQALAVAATRAAYHAQLSQIPWDPFNAVFILTHE